ncbi:MAG: hypothetical protein ACREM2_10180 [Vulcanimicrobiaceae bacterium]
MTKTRWLATAALCALVSGGLLAPQAARANGAASTRNIIFGAAAAGAATYLIVHHNAQVHQKYAQYDHEQAALEAQNSREAAAYQSERSAYLHESAETAAYRQEVDRQHALVVSQDRELASLKSKLASANRTALAAAPARAPAAAPDARVAFVHPSTSLGWGAF